MLAGRQHQGHVKAMQHAQVEVLLAAQLPTLPRFSTPHARKLCLRWRVHSGLLGLSDASLVPLQICREVLTRVAQHAATPHHQQLSPIQAVIHS
jgi:hypothetical protein